MCIRDRLGDVKRRRYVIFAFIGLLFSSAAVFGSGTRGAWLSLPFLFIIPFVLAPIKVKAKIAVFAFFTISLIGVYQTPSVNGRITIMQKHFDKYINSTDMEDTVRKVTPIGIRLELWKASWEVFTSNPIFGVGPGNLSRYMQDNNYGYRGKYHSKISGHRNSHSMYFKSLSERGLIGILTVLLILGLPLVFYLQEVWGVNKLKIQVYAVSGLLIIIVFAVGGLTIGSLHKTDLSIFYVFTTALFCGWLLPFKNDLIKRN